METPPAGNRGSKLVVLGFPEVVRLPCEPEALPEPLASGALDELSLLSPLCVGLGLSELGGDVLFGACDDWSLSIYKSASCSK